MQKCLNLFKTSSSLRFYTTLLKQFNFITIKPDYTVKDVVYKEQIWEFLSMKGSELSNLEVIELIRKFNRYQILESELKDLKNFFRNLFQLTLTGEDNEEVASEILKCFLNKMETIESLLKTKKFQVEMENNEFDLDFSAVEYSALRFGLRHSKIFTSNDKLVTVFEFMNKFRYNDNKVLNDKITELIVYYQRNNMRKYDNPLLVKTKLVSIILQLSIETDYNHVDKIKYLLNDFLVEPTLTKGQDRDASIPVTNELIESMGGLLFYIEEKLSMIMNPCDDLIHKELKLVQQLVRRILLDNSIDPEAIVNSVRLSKETKTKEIQEEQLSYEEEKEKVFKNLKENI